MPRWSCGSSQAVIDVDDKRQRHRDDALSRYQAIPQPNKWPATLNDFYRLIVRGKDEAENQRRFKSFLRYMVEKEQQEIRQQMERIPECGRKDKSNPSVFDTLRFRLLETEQAVEREVDRRFVDYKQHLFQPSELPILDPYLPNEWTRLARDYQDWWEVEKISAKARAGRARARAYKRKRKVTKHEATIHLAAVAFGKVQADSAAEAKKTLTQLRKKHSAF